MDAVRSCGRPPKQFFMGLVVGLGVAMVLLGSSVFNVDLRRPFPGSHHGNPVSRFFSSHQDGHDGHDVHEQLDRAIHEQGPAANYNFHDEHSHNDDDTLAKRLKQKVRVLIWVMTSPQNLQAKARVVRDTWGRRANKLLFFSSETDPDFPTVGLNVSEGREHLTAKTMNGFRYVYQHHFNDADWFMKVDDDTYVILENLRYFLSGENTSEPVFFGHHFKVIVKQGYYSGGGGYVLSKEALRRLAEKGQNKKLCRQDGGAEDAELGHCMQNLGVRTANTTDALGRSRFHCFDPETFLFGGFPDWYYKYDANGAHKGEHAISDYAITFHYVPPRKMMALEFYIYHLSPYGIVMGVQNLNQQHRTTNNTISKTIK